MKQLLIASLLMVAHLAGQEIRLTQVTSGVSAPTDIQNANDGSGRMFIVQQSGIIRILRNGALVATPFLNISSKTRADGERGLLGLAFPPGFAQKQRFYVNYTDLSGNTTIARYRVSSSADAADASSEVVLLKIQQPFANHNGGQVRFGPDGYLYIGMGDGGSGGDPMGNGQNRNALLGKMLRIDVETDPGNVRIPPDNPFVNTSGARPEIWAYGFRNPWRFSFDRATGDLWIADVGQDTWEEVDFQPASSKGGENYGWNTMEGNHCFRANCSMQGLVLPVAEYSHTDGCSVTGGFVYRGNASPALRGTYIYADYCSGRIWGIDRQGSAFANRLLLASGYNITTFGEDEAGEIYAARASSGEIYRVEGSGAPRLTAAGVVNAASFAGGLTPGSLSTVFAVGVTDNAGINSASGVPLTTSLNGVSVMVNGAAVPIHSIANSNGQEQVNFEAPWDLNGSTATVAVSRNGQTSSAVTVPVAQVQPGIYASNGSNAIVVHNADYSLVTAARPLVPNEYAFVYAAGLGRVSNQPALGAAAPTSPLAAAMAPITLTLGGVPCDVQYAGLAPGFVGVYQVNFRVPARVASGTQDLILTAGSVNGPAVKAPVQ